MFKLISGKCPLQAPAMVFWIRNLFVYRGRRWVSKLTLVEPLKMSLLTGTSLSWMHEWILTPIMFSTKWLTFLVSVWQKHVLVQHLSTSNLCAPLPDPFSHTRHLTSQWMREHVQFLCFAGLLSIHNVVKVLSCIQCAIVFQCQTWTQSSPFMTKKLHTKIYAYTHRTSTTVEYMGFAHVSTVCRSCRNMRICGLPRSPNYIRLVSLLWWRHSRWCASYLRAWFE